MPAILTPDEHALINGLRWFAMEYVVQRAAHGDLSLDAQHPWSYATEWAEKIRSSCSPAAVVRARIILDSYGI